MPKESDQPKRALELAREQSLTELEQAIGDREQLGADRDQARIDQEQFHHDEQRHADSITGRRPARILDDRQARIDREQATRDVGQEALDHAQEGRDNQQEALDETRVMLHLPTSEQPHAADPSAIQRGASERASAARARRDRARPGTSGHGPRRSRRGPSPRITSCQAFSATAASGVATRKLKLSSRYSRTTPLS
jgi:hypothetical protein